MWRCTAFSIFSVLLLVSPADLAAQCTIGAGETETVTTAVSCGTMSVAGTLIIESTGSVTGGDDSTLNGSGATITVNGGSFLVNGRFNLGTGSDGYININSGGTFTVTGTWKFPDDDGGEHRMWINSGIVHSGDIELRGDRDAIIYVGGGVLRLDYVGTGGSSDYYDPDWWISQGWLQVAPGYDELVIQDMGSYTEISATSTLPRVQFETETSEALESTGSVALAVNITNAQPSQTYTVNYAPVAGGSATYADDYLLPPDTLVFGPGQTSKNITIAIINDGAPENDETLIVELSNPTGADIMLGNIYRHTHTILDPHPGAGFDTASSSGLENIASVVIPVSLSGTLSQAATVDYAATGTATNGVDYTLSAGTLYFDAFDVTEYIEIIVNEDDIEEVPDETIVVALSNPSPNIKMMTQNQHTYTIIDNEKGILFDGLIWYYSEYPNTLYLDSEGRLVWAPVEKLAQIVTRLPEQSLSQVGDKVEFTYWWMSDGQNDCPDCFECPDSCFDDDITCIAGTSDFRVGLFEADGEYIADDGFDTSSSVFDGYKGYGFRFGPNMKSGPTRWVDCTGEVHKTGNFAKKPVDSSNLLTENEGLEDYIPGFELPPGEWSLWTLLLERTESDTVEVSITLNDRTYTYTDDSSSGQPDKIDVFAIHMRNGRPYSIWSIEPICELAADFDDDKDVDGRDLRIFVDKWLNRCRPGDWCEGTDTSHNGMVNFADYTLFMTEWQQNCN